MINLLTVQISNLDMCRPRTHAAATDSRGCTDQSIALLFGWIYHEERNASLTAKMTVLTEVSEYCKITMGPIRRVEGRVPLRADGQGLQPGKPAPCSFISWL